MNNNGSAQLIVLVLLALLVAALFWDQILDFVGIFDAYNTGFFGLGWVK